MAGIGILIMTQKYMAISSMFASKGVPMPVGVRYLETHFALIINTQREVFVTIKFCQVVVKDTTNTNFWILIIGHAPTIKSMANLYLKQDQWIIMLLHPITFQQTVLAQCHHLVVI